MEGLLLHTLVPFRKYWKAEICFIPALPSKLVPEIMKACHDSPYSGRLASGKTYEKLKNHVWFPNMYSVEKMYLVSCEKYLRQKAMNCTPDSPLQSLPIPSAILEMVID